MQLIERQFRGEFRTFRKFLSEFFQTMHQARLVDLNHSDSSNGLSTDEDRTSAALLGDDRGNRKARIHTFFKHAITVSMTS